MEKISFNASQDLQIALTQADQAADQAGLQVIDIEHVLLGFVYLDNRCKAIQMLLRLGIQVRALEEYISNAYKGGYSSYAQNKDHSAELQQALLDATDIARDSQSRQVDTNHLLLAMAKNTEGKLAQILKEFNFTVDSVRQAFVDLLKLRRAAG